MKMRRMEKTAYKMIRSPHTLAQLKLNKIIVTFPQKQKQKGKSKKESQIAEE